MEERDVTKVGITADTHLADEQTTPERLQETYSMQTTVTIIHSHNSPHHFLK